MRTRVLKTKFFRDDRLAELPFEYRLLLQGLWCLADRAGRLEDRPKRIRLDVFPYDDVDVADGLEELAFAGLIVRYAVGDARFIQILEFAEQQHVSSKERQSVIPPPDSISTESGHASGESDTTTEAVECESGTVPAAELNHSSAVT